MAKIDITTIEGYRDDMTSDEKLALIADYDVPEAQAQPTEPNPEKYVSKSAFDKTARELAEAKRQLRTRMSDEEQKAAEIAAAQSAMETELQILRKEKQMNGFRAGFLGQGFSEKVATECAEAMVEGDFDRVFSGIAAFKSEFEKSLRAELLKNTPAPAAGGAASVDYTAAIEAARERNDMVTVAALMRRQQQGI